LYRKDKRIARKISYYSRGYGDHGCHPDKRIAKSSPANKKTCFSKQAFLWWCYLIFERKGCICPLLFGHFANEQYAKIVLFIVKNARLENIS